MFEAKMNFDEEVRDNGFFVLCERSTCCSVSLRELPRNFCELDNMKLVHVYCGTWMDLRFFYVKIFSPD